MSETFGPEYVRPKTRQEDCPYCPCCTRVLCERGRTTYLRCDGHTSVETRAAVADCPCSAEETRGTAAWRAARVRAVSHALSPQALGKDIVAVLALVAHGQDTAGREDQVRTLAMRRYVRLTDGDPLLTELGELYLRTVNQTRKASGVTVLDVDQTAGTARVLVMGWSMSEPVTVLLDQLCSETGLTAGELVGWPLEASADLAVMLADDVVLSGIRVVGAVEGRVDGAPKRLVQVVQPVLPVPPTSPVSGGTGSPGGELPATTADPTSMMQAAQAVRAAVPGDSEAPTEVLPPVTDGPPPTTAAALPLSVLRAGQEGGR
ncbi:hypothetical protein [Kitasatospora sp. NPDC058046]|uniref:hypothetical protein n=1 Tax=Kitasatospora sp. NPDC058046 TaxID=3346312 RepID=UPI0036D93194